MIHASVLLMDLVPWALEENLPHLRFDGKEHARKRCLRNRSSLRLDDDEKGTTDFRLGTCFIFKFS